MKSWPGVKKVSMSQFEFSCPTRVSIDNVRYLSFFTEAVGKNWNILPYIKLQYMKRYYSPLALVALIALTSCGGDDEASPSYKFKDQTAQGKINDEAFSYGDGYADVETDEIRITLTLPQTEDICDIMPEGNTVTFYVDNEVKLSKLSFNPNSFEGQTVTLYDGTTSHIATQGAIEILSVTDTEVTGRLDARSDSETYINGNFTVQRCPL
jgi:hypothetical protein